MSGRLRIQTNFRSPSPPKKKNEGDEIDLITQLRDLLVVNENKKDFLLCSEKDRVPVVDAFAFNKISDFKGVYSNSSAMIPLYKKKKRTWFFLPRCSENNLMFKTRNLGKFELKENRGYVMKDFSHLPPEAMERQYKKLFPSEEERRRAENKYLTVNYQTKLENGSFLAFFRIKSKENHTPKPSLLRSATCVVSYDSPDFRGGGFSYYNESVITIDKSSFVLPFSVDFRHDLVKLTKSRKYGDLSMTKLQKARRYNVSFSFVRPVKRIEEKWRIEICIGNVLQHDQETTEQLTLKAGQPYIFSLQQMYDESRFKIRNSQHNEKLKVKLSKKNPVQVIEFPRTLELRNREYSIFHDGKYTRTRCFKNLVPRPILYPYQLHGIIGFHEAEIVAFHEEAKMIQGHHSTYPCSIAKSFVEIKQKQVQDWKDINLYIHQLLFIMNYYIKFCRHKYLDRKVGDFGENKDTVKEVFRFEYSKWKKVIKDKEKETEKKRRTGKSSSKSPSSLLRKKEKRRIIDLTKFLEIIDHKPKLVVQEFLDSRREGIINRQEEKTEVNKTKSYFRKIDSEASAKHTDKFENSLTGFHVPPKNEPEKQIFFLLCNLKCRSDNLLRILRLFQEREETLSYELGRFVPKKRKDEKYKQKLRKKLAKKYDVSRLHKLDQDELLKVQFYQRIFQKKYDKVEEGRQYDEVFYDRIVTKDVLKKLLPGLNVTGRTELAQTITLMLQGQVKVIEYLCETVIPQIREIHDNLQPMILSFDPPDHPIGGEGEGNGRREVGIMLGSTSFLDSTGDYDESGATSPIRQRKQSFSKHVGEVLKPQIFSSESINNAFKEKLKSDKNDKKKKKKGVPVSPKKTLTREQRIIEEYKDVHFEDLRDRFKTRFRERYRKAIKSLGSLLHLFSSEKTVKKTIKSFGYPGLYESVLLPFQEKYWCWGDVHGDLFIHKGIRKMEEELRKKDSEIRQFYSRTKRRKLKKRKKNKDEHLLEEDLFGENDDEEVEEEDQERYDVRVPPTWILHLFVIFCDDLKKRYEDYKRKLESLCRNELLTTETDDDDENQVFGITPQRVRGKHSGTIAIKNLENQRRFQLRKRQMSEKHTKFDVLETGIERILQAKLKNAMKKTEVVYHLFCGKYVDTSRIRLRLNLWDILEREEWKKQLSKYEKSARLDLTRLKECLPFLQELDSLKNQEEVQKKREKEARSERRRERRRERKEQERERKKRRENKKRKKRGDVEVEVGDTRITFVDEEIENEGESSSEDPGDAQRKYDDDDSDDDDSDSIDTESESEGEEEEDTERKKSEKEKNKNQNESVSMSELKSFVNYRKFSTLQRVNAQFHHGAHLGVFSNRESLSSEIEIHLETGLTNLRKYYYSIVRFNPFLSFDNMCHKYINKKYIEDHETMMDHSPKSRTKKMKKKSKKKQDVVLSDSRRIKIIKKLLEEKNLIFSEFHNINIQSGNDQSSSKITSTYASSSDYYRYNKKKMGSHSQVHSLENNEELSATIDRKLNDGNNATMIKRLHQNMLKNNSVNRVNCVFSKIVRKQIIPSIESVFYHGFVDRYSPLRILALFWEKKTTIWELAVSCFYNDRRYKNYFDLIGILYKYNNSSSSSNEESFGGEKVVAEDEGQNNLRFRSFLCKLITEKRMGEFYRDWCENKKIVAYYSQNSILKQKNVAKSIQAMLDRLDRDFKLNIHVELNLVEE